MSEGVKKTVFIFLDTNKHVSPFDMLTAINLFPEAKILTYSNVTAEDTRKIVQDAMFPRGPKGAKYTKLFIGGHDVEKAQRILEVAEEVMFPPFELATIVDPKGAYTTASAAVAKTLVLSIQKGFGGFEGKKIAVLAGTGPVGRTAARLYASEGANVIVTSRKLAKSTAVAEKINEEIGKERVKGVEASAFEQFGEAVQNMEIVLSAGAAGIQMLPLDVLKKYGGRCKVVADVNAIPPVGVEGVKPKDDGVEVLPGVWGIGGLTIGTFKNKVEAELFKKAVEAKKGIFDYKVAYKTAKSLLQAKSDDWWSSFRSVWPPG
ncbi:MAG: methylene-tetrahydromethanopterin dehydrogenase N-terminal domain-containing protein [Thermoproteota archaeon]|nr:methylene-tetrahydromethanopterin dehydrogenase N-terminal domain-containing protein [Thermoproteota archaeon]